MFLWRSVCCICWCRRKQEPGPQQGPSAPAGCIWMLLRRAGGRALWYCLLHLRGTCRGALHKQARHALCVYLSAINLNQSIDQSIDQSINLTLQGAIQKLLTAAKGLEAGYVMRALQASYGDWHSFSTLPFGVLGPGHRLVHMLRMYVCAFATHAQLMDTASYFPSCRASCASGWQSRRCWWPWRMRRCCTRTAAQRAAARRWRGGWSRRRRSSSR